MWVLFLIFMCSASGLFSRPVLHESALWRSIASSSRIATQQKEDILTKTETIDSYFYDTTDAVVPTLCPVWEACVQCTIESGEAIAQLSLVIAELRRQISVVSHSIAPAQTVYVRLQAIEEWGRYLLLLFNPEGPPARALGGVRETSEKEQLKQIVLYVSGALALCVMGSVCLWIAYRSKGTATDGAGYRSLSRYSYACPPLPRSSDSSARPVNHEAFTLLPQPVLERLQHESGLVVHATDAGTGGMVIEKPSPKLRDTLMREASCAHLGSDDALRVHETAVVARALSQVKPLEAADVVPLLSQEEVLVPLVGHLVCGRGPDNGVLRSIAALLDEKEGGVSQVWAQEIVMQCGDCITEFIKARPKESTSVTGCMGRRSTDEKVIAAVEFLKGSKRPFTFIVQLMGVDKRQQQESAHVIVRSLLSLIREHTGITPIAAQRTVVGALWHHKRYRKLLKKWHRRLNPAIGGTKDLSGKGFSSNDQSASPELLNDTKAAAGAGAPPGINDKKT